MCSTPTPIPRNRWEERIARYSPEMVGKNRSTTAVPIPAAFGRCSFCSAAIREPVGYPARQIAKERGTSTFRLTMPILENIELTEKATPLSISRTPNQPMP